MNIPVLSLELCWLWIVLKYSNKRDLSAITSQLFLKENYSSKVPVYIGFEQNWKHTILSF